MSRDSFKWIRLLRAQSNMAWNVSREGASTPLWAIHFLHAFSGKHVPVFHPSHYKNFFLIPSLNPGSFSLNFWQLVSNPSIWAGLKKIRKMPNVTSPLSTPVPRCNRQDWGGKNHCFCAVPKEENKSNRIHGTSLLSAFFFPYSPRYFWQLSQACAVLFLSQILFPWHILLPSTELQPVLQITCVDPKTFEREKLPYLLHSLERDAPHCSVPYSAGIQDKISALETEIACGLISPRHGVTMQTERLLRATTLAWSLPSLGINN